MEELPSGYTKSKRVAFLLALFLGAIGAHRLYLGRVDSGLALLGLSVVGICTFGLILPLVALWLLADLAAIAMGALSDADGYPLI